MYLRNILKSEGPKALCSGLSVSMMGVLHVMTLFPLLERLKIEAKSSLEPNTLNSPLSTKYVAACSIIAKFIASAVTYPHEVIRTRLQDYRGSH